jgi:hypothetical protein
MKKTFSFFILLYFILSNVSKAESPWGEGELQLSDNAAN